MAHCELDVSQSHVHFPAPRELVVVMVVVEE